MSYFYGHILAVFLVRKMYVKGNNIKVMPKACPMDGYSKREDMKELIKSFQKDLPHIRSNLYGAIKRAGIDGWK